MLALLWDATSAFPPACFQRCRLVCAAPAPALIIHEQTCWEAFGSCGVACVSVSPPSARKMCLFALTMHDVVSQTTDIVCGPSCRLRSRSRLWTRINSCSDSGKLAPPGGRQRDGGKRSVSWETSCWDRVDPASAPVYPQKRLKKKNRSFASSGRRTDGQVRTGGCPR